MSKINYKKTTQRIKKQKKTLDKQSEKVKCACGHKRDGQATLVRKKGGQPTDWLCYQCEKNVNLKRITDEEMDEAIDVLDRAIDVIKFSCRENVAADTQFQAKLAKTQYRVRNVVKQAYKACLNENSRRERRSSNNGGGVKWG